MARGVEDPALKEQNQGRITRETTETTAAQLPGRAAEVPGADVQGGGQGTRSPSVGSEGPSAAAPVETRCGQARGWGEAAPQPSVQGCGFSSATV